MITTYTINEAGGPLICLFILFAWAWKRYSLVAAAIAFWIGFSSLRVFESPINPYAGAPLGWMIALSSLAAASLVEFTLFLGMPQLLSKTFWFRFFHVVAGINMVLLLIGFAMSSHSAGILFETSMSGCLGVCLLPIIPQDVPRNKTHPRRWEDLYLVMYLFSILSILLTRSSQPIALLFLLFWMQFLHMTQWNFLRKLMGSFSLVAIGIGTRWLLCPRAVFDDGGRVYMWTFFMDWFWKHSNRFVGAGAGTFSAIGPTLSDWVVKDFNHDYGLWAWAHSDWIQIGIEQGMVGLILAIVMFGWLIYRARKNTALIQSLILYGAFGLANMPLRYATSAILGGFLFRWATDEGPEDFSPSPQTL